MGESSKIGDWARGRGVERGTAQHHRGKAFGAREHAREHTLNGDEAKAHASAKEASRHAENATKAAEKAGGHMDFHDAANAHDDAAGAHRAAGNREKDDEHTEKARALRAKGYEVQSEGIKREATEKLKAMGKDGGGEQARDERGRFASK